MKNAMPPTGSFQSLIDRQAQGLAKFSTHLEQSRFWYILPKDETDRTKAVGLFDAQAGRQIPTATELRAFLDKYPFAHVRSQRDEKILATLQSSTRILWNNQDSDSYSYDEAADVVKEFRWAELEHWDLPTKEILHRFATDDANPYRQGEKYRLATADGLSESHWLTARGCCDVDEGYWGVTCYQDGHLFACNLRWEDMSDTSLLLDLVERGWELVAVNSSGKPSFESGFFPKGVHESLTWMLGGIARMKEGIFSPGGVAQANGLDMEALLATWASEQQTLLSVSQKPVVLNPRDYWINMSFANLDYTPCRLPELDKAQLTDPEKGLWELWGEEPSVLKSIGYVARDPYRDVQHRSVAIDFGTSSTVVAMDTASGARELLRIGARDFYQAVEAKHFENPTVLECLDFTAFNEAWTANAYRPELNWDWMRAAHEAQTSFRGNPGETSVLASILLRLKQWALRSSENRRVRLTDRRGREIELPPHAERNPMRGQPLAVSADDSFDPIELYAWYLGMAINWRGRGLFLKYYLSFPVKYPREVKERILGSFRRGLQRSLPETLVRHHPQVLNDFEVTDLASEPAAYAAAALPHLGVEPSDKGVPYAVFDFGGGTSDFDYGLLRWATDEEEDQGYERVFEHMASEGDNFLGGENLLEHLVYESFKHNLPVLREKRIQFTQPIDAQSFAGSEAFLAATQAAQTNSVMLATKLRAFMEKGLGELAPQIKLDLIDANGDKHLCELALDAKTLDELLASRIRRGVEAFLAGLARLSSELPAGEPIHILLAGNGCRSRHIQALFGTDSPLWQELLAQAFGPDQEDWDGEVPDIVVHPPLPMDEQHPHAPTTKTGVALGLLRLAPGENTLLKNHLHDGNGGQAPFAWFVGRLRRGRFEPVLAPNVAYGEWRELGALQQGVFSMYVSSSLRAHAGLSEGDAELKKHRLDFPAAPAGSRVFARAVQPYLLELVTAIDLEALKGEAFTAKSFSLE